MKSKFKYIGIISLMVFSFYYTNEIAVFLQYKTALMKEIIKNKQDYEVKSVDAVIEGDYIIPGLSGLSVDEGQSYNKMKESGVFNENYYVFKEEKPNFSLEDNKNKIINRGNAKKNAVSILITDSSLITIENKLTFLMNLDNVFKSNTVEIINDETNDYYQMERFLNNNNYNKNICIINKNNTKECQLNNKYLVLPTYTINNSNLVSYLNNISSGDIIKVSNLDKEKFNVLLTKIYNKGLDIVYLSKLISENN